MAVADAQVDAAAIDAALRPWRQGDVTLDAGLEFLHLADLGQPLSPAAQRARRNTGSEVESDIRGSIALIDEVSDLVLLSQTCDIVRACRTRPFVEVAPLVHSADIESIRRLKRPAFAYVPAMASRSLVADLDRTMTVEKSIVAGWTRILGCPTDKDARAFASALARK